MSKKQFMIIRYMDELKPCYEQNTPIHCYCERVLAQIVLLQLKIEYQQNQLMTIQ